MFRDIHNKPKSVREQYALWGAIGITTVIAIVWVVSLEYRFDDETERANRGAIASFFSDFGSTVASVFSSVDSAANESEQDSDAAPSAATTSRPVFELTPRTAPAVETGSTGRSVRVEPASERASSTPSED